jgi:hypothetical protein
MGTFYFPNLDNLRKLTTEEVDYIYIGIQNLRGADLPYKFHLEIDEIIFLEDPGMDLKNGILGYTKFGTDRVLLSPIIVTALKHKDINGIPNNNDAMNTVIHELTHLQQMSWLGGLCWAFLNIPIISAFTIEKWATTNGTAAADYLENLYNEMRNL